MSRNKGVTRARIPHSFSQEAKKASFTWSLMLKLWNNMTIKLNDLASLRQWNIIQTLRTMMNSPEIKNVNTNDS